jgi:dipeptidyl aminopeptidase/acylaminoacyl peptidase
VKPRDIAAIVSLGRPTLAPDGRTAVVAAASPDLDEDRYASSLWSVTLDGSKPPRRLTSGGQDSAPSISPDGNWLAFVRREEKKKPQLWLLPTAGGDSIRRTDLPGGAGAPQWSPDSSRIAFSVRVPAAGRHGTDEKITPDKEPPRRITGLQYRLDNVGFLVDNREQVFVVSIGDGDDSEPTQITEGDFDSSGVTWSPSGDTLAFVSARNPRDDTLLNDVFTVAADGKDLKRVTDTSLGVYQVHFSPDGESLVLLAADYGPDGEDWIGAQGGVFTVPTTGGTPQRLTDAESISITDVAMVVADDRVLVTNENRGAVELMAVPLTGDAEPVVLSTGRRVVSGVDVRDDTVVVTFADPTTCGELGRLVGDEIVGLTDFGSDLRATKRVHEQLELTATAPDGQELHGFLVVPEGVGPHPVLLMIHGGPFTQYSWSVFDEAQAYASAGYAVVYTNPRGSSGYGRAYGRHIIGDVGERSSVDLLAMLDVALQRPDLDETRLGVLGGSHGGYMTSWLVGHSDRFKAAVSERAVNAIDSFIGSSDIGWGFADPLYYGSDPQRRHEQSPLTYADRITTPLLIIHSEQDWRCPIEQAQRMYVALKKRDATVELLLFPGEGHELSRSGLPSHRVARFEAILDWFGHHLLGQPRVRKSDDAPSNSDH